MSFQLLKNKNLIQNGALIDGEWIDTKKTFDVLNPATQEKIGSVSDCGAQETKNAIDAAEQAFILWSKKTGNERHGFLKKWYELIVQNADDLAMIMSTEQGKPLAEAKGEVTVAAEMVSWVAEEARRIHGETIPSLDNDQRYVLIKQPVGVCAAITPWNFPVSMITRKIAPALAAGCTIVLKPSDETPYCATALAYLAQEAGIPKGVLNIITASNAKEVGQVLCESSKVRKLSFTGSTPVGKVLYKQCGDTVKKLSLELGGNAPFIIFDDADIDLAVKGLMASKFRNAGQTCICANRIFVHEKIMDVFTKKLTEKVSALVVGDGTKEKTTLGPLINKKAVDKVKELVEDAKSKGAKVIFEGDVSKQGVCFSAPVILSNTNEKMRFYKEEIFGPVVSLYSFKDEDEVLKKANDTNFGLAAYCYTENLGRSFRMSEGLEYGMVGVNVPVVSNAATPFGGVKESGVGREGGKWGIEEFVELKYINFGHIQK